VGETHAPHPRGFHPPYPHAVPDLIRDLNALQTLTPHSHIPPHAALTRQNRTLRTYALCTACVRIAYAPIPHKTARQHVLLVLRAHTPRNYPTRVACLSRRTRYISGMRPALAFFVLAPPRAFVRPVEECFL
jgi:hypothetical protein